MSRILPKPFDPDKKIVQSEFNGSPNLLTSPDINRQISAIKYQLDQLDEKVGVISDFKVGEPTFVNANGKFYIEFTPDWTYMSVKGCKFNPSKDGIRHLIPTKGGTLYLVLVAGKKTVSFGEDDEISGAKFQDGSFYPAANQVVYENERIILVDNPDYFDSFEVSDDGIVFVAVLASVKYFDNKHLIIDSNCLRRKESLKLGVSQSQDSLVAQGNFQTNPLNVNSVSGATYLVNGSSLVVKLSGINVVANATYGQHINFKLLGVLPLDISRYLLDKMQLGSPSMNSAYDVGQNVDSWCVYEELMTSDFAHSDSEAMANSTTFTGRMHLVLVIVNYEDNSYIGIGVYESGITRWTERDGRYNFIMDRTPCDFPNDVANDVTCWFPNLCTKILVE